MILSPWLELEPPLRCTRRLENEMTALEMSQEKTKTASIIVNTRSHAWAEKEIGFEQAVELAFPGQPYDPAGTTVEYSRGHGHDKSLRPGESVRVKDGMVFDVEPANRS